MNLGTLTTPVIIAVIGVTLVLGLIFMGGKSEVVPLENGTQNPATSTHEDSNASEEQNEEPKPIVTTPKPQSPTPKPPINESTPPVVKPTPEPTPVPTPTPTPEPAPAPTPTPAWTPTFLASSRITPEIPSENERATLPACGSMKFTQDVLNIAAVNSITETSTTGSGMPSDTIMFNFTEKGTNQRYALTFPNDVYVTHITVETGITADSSDTTVYFALCKDVFGFVKNIKELSTELTNIITDSDCAIKPHTGPNACHIKVLELVGRGSFIGNGGMLGGATGFGVFDLRKQRGIPSPESSPVRASFAVCPFDYFIESAGMKSRLSAGSTLCAQ